MRYMFAIVISPAIPFSSALPICSSFALRAGPLDRLMHQLITLTLVLGVPVLRALVDFGGWGRVQDVHRKHIHASSLIEGKKRGLRKVLKELMVRKHGANEVGTNVGM